MNKNVKNTRTQKILKNFSFKMAGLKKGIRKNYYIEKNFFKQFLPFPTPSKVANVFSSSNELRNLREAISHDKRKGDFQKAAIDSEILLRQYGITQYSYIFGSLLSLCRDEYLEPIMGDLDIAIHYKEYEKLYTLLENNPRFMPYSYNTELIGQKKSKRTTVKKVIAPKDFNTDKERLGLVKVFDALFQVDIDFYIIHDMEDKGDVKQFIISEIPWEFGYSYYMNVSEFSKGFAILRVPSVNTPAYMRENRKEYPGIFMLEFQVMKESAPWLSRAYGETWSTHRMIMPTDKYYSNLAKRAKIKEQIPGYYLATSQYPTGVYRIDENFSYRNKFKL